MANVLTTDMGCVVTDLRKIEEPHQFEGFYRANGLHSVEDKINCLKKSMNIRAMCCDEEETQEEILAGLEETALLGYWKAYR